MTAMCGAHRGPPDAQPAVHLHVAAVVGHSQAAAKQQDGQWAGHCTVANEGAASADLECCKQGVGRRSASERSRAGGAPAASPLVHLQLTPAQQIRPAGSHPHAQQHPAHLLEICQVGALQLLRLQWVADGGGVQRNLARAVVPPGPLAWRGPGLQSKRHRGSGKAGKALECSCT